MHPKVLYNPSSDNLLILFSCIGIVVAAWRLNYSLTHDPEKLQAYNLVLKYIIETLKETRHQFVARVLWEVKGDLMFYFIYIEEGGHRLG